jgi:hypothetical protein
MKLELQNPRLERYITEQVNAGNFPTPEAVVDHLFERAAVGADPPADDVERELELSEQEAAQGETVDFDEFAARIRKQYGIA